MGRLSYFRDGSKVYSAAFMKVATKTCTLHDESFIIEKSQKLIIPMFSIHRDPKYYPDPLRFDPKRFSKEQKPQQPNDTWHLLAVWRLTSSVHIGNVIIQLLLQ